MKKIVNFKNVTFVFRLDTDYTSVEVEKNNTVVAWHARRRDGSVECGGTEYHHWMYFVRCGRVHP